MEDWYALLEQAGMNQRDLATALDKSPSVISALVNNIKGPAAAGKKLKRQALDYLHRRIQSSESVSQGRSESVKPHLAMRDDAPDYSTVAECKSRIKQLEKELAELRITVRVQAREISSTLSAEAEALLDEAEKPDAPGGPAKP